MFCHAAAWSASCSHCPYQARVSDPSARCQQERSFLVHRLAAIQDCKRCTPQGLAKARTATLKQWAVRAKALEEDESRFKLGLHPEVAKILAPKRLLLWKELMSQFSYPDLGVFDLITSGISLTGEVESSGLFSPVNKPATLSVQQLGLKQTTSPTAFWPRWALSRQRLKNCFGEDPAGGRERLACGAHLQAFSCARVRTSAEREKTRLIDDMRLVNQSAATFESPRPHTVDVLAAMGKELMATCPNVPIKGKAYELTAAYRQLPLHPDTAWVSFVSIWDCERKEPAIFRLKALPFGASKSVYSFLRTSHSLRRLACKALSTVWTLYYDDFVCLSSEALASHTDYCARAFFFLLGWKFSSSGDKHMEFSQNLYSPWSHCAARRVFGWSPDHLQHREENM